MDSRSGRRQRDMDDDSHDDADGVLKEEQLRSVKRVATQEGAVGRSEGSMRTMEVSRKRRVEELRTGVGARYPYDEGSYHQHHQQQQPSANMVGDGWGLPPCSVLDPDFEVSGVANPLAARGMPPAGKKSGGVEWQGEDGGEEKPAPSERGPNGMGGSHSGGDGRALGGAEWGSGRFARVERDEDLHAHPYSQHNFMLRSLTLHRLGRAENAATKHY